MTTKAAAAKGIDQAEKWQCGICGRRIPKPLALAGKAARHFASHYPSDLIPDYLLGKRKLKGTRGCPPAN